jgi:hypothetical protein
MATEIKVKSLMITVLDINRNGAKLGIVTEYEGSGHLLKETNEYVLGFQDILNINIIKQE